MYVEFTTRPAPEIAAGHNPQAQMSALRTAGMPLLAIRGAGVESDRLWESTIHRMRESGFSGGTAQNFYVISNEPGMIAAAIDSTNADLSDTGLHLDLPPTSDFEVATIRMHQLLGGTYTARFFEIAEQYGPSLRPMRWDYFTKFHLPKGTDDHYRRGHVDPTVLSPAGYEFTARPGDIVIFRQGGRLPVAHAFRTTRFPRSFRITEFSVERP